MSILYFRLPLTALASHCDTTVSIIITTVSNFRSCHNSCLRNRRNTFRRVDTESDHRPPAPPNLLVKSTTFCQSIRRRSATTRTPPQTRIRTRTSARTLTEAADSWLRLVPTASSLFRWTKTRSTLIISVRPAARSSWRRRAATVSWSETTETRVHIRPRPDVDQVCSFSMFNCRKVIAHLNKKNFDCSCLQKII